MRLRHFMGWLSAGLALLFLSSCGSPVIRTETGARETTEPAGSRKHKPAAPARRGGAYYKDDGPAEDIPGNLDTLPDAAPRIEPLHRFANRPYVVLGRSYVPETRLRPFRQRGVASWYGKKFHGQKTSIGETYDMFAMTAAHPTLAIPSYARVTHIGSGKSVVVRVIDRGPFHADRIIDLSYAAAYRLGYVTAGSALVEVEAIMPADATSVGYDQVAPPSVGAARPVDAKAEADDMERLVATLDGRAAPVTRQDSEGSRGIFLQLGAFSSVENAENLRAHLTREFEWLDAAKERIHIHSSAGMHRLHLGPYASRNEAESVAGKIRAALGYAPGLVTR